MAQVLAIAFIVGFASRARPDQWVLLSDVGVNRLPSRAMTPLETVRNVPAGFAWWHLAARKDRLPRTGVRRGSRP